MEKASEHRLVSRKDAAEFLKCSQQTITNWVKSGVIKGHTIDGRLFVDANTLNALVDTVGELEATKQKVDELRNQLANEQRTLERELAAIREELLLCKSVFGSITRSMLSSLVLSYEPVLASKESDIIRSVLCCGNIEEVAQKYDIRENQVLRIFDKGCRRIRANRFDKIYEENNQYKQRVRELEQENKNLRNGIVVEPKDTKNEWLHNTLLVDCDLTVRTLNILRVAGANTVGDLINLRKTDLLRIRNAGKKTLIEIECFLEANTLKLKDQR